MKNLILLGMILFFVLFYASTVSAQCQGNVFTISLSWKTEKSVHGFTSTELDYCAGLYYDPANKGIFEENYGTGTALLGTAYTQGYADSVPAELSFDSYAPISNGIYTTIGNHYVIAYYQVYVPVFYDYYWYDPFGLGFEEIGGGDPLYAPDEYGYWGYATYWVSSPQYVGQTSNAIDYAGQTICLPGQGFTSAGQPCSSLPGCESGLQFSSTGAICPNYVPPVAPPDNNGLTVAFDTTDIRPAGIRGSLGTNTRVRACILGLTGNGIRVNLKLADVSGTLSGHIVSYHQGNRPLGKLGKSTGYTNPEGCFVTTYYPGFISGRIKVFAEVGGYEAFDVAEVGVPGLARLFRGTNYRLNGSGRAADCDAPQCTADYMSAPHRKAHESNHWVVPAAILELKGVADDYKQRFYGSGYISPDQMVTYNDASLAWGGKFDLGRRWLNKGAHAEHRDGKNVDTKSENIPADRVPVFRTIANNRNFGILHHTKKAPHFHFRWGEPENNSTTISTVLQNGIDATMTAFNGMSITPSGLASNAAESIFERPITQAEFESWHPQLTNAMSQGSAVFLHEIKAFYQQLFASQEYIQRQRTDSQFVVDVFESHLFREPTEEELAHWTGYLLSLGEGINELIEPELSEENDPKMRSGTTGPTLSQSQRRQMFLNYFETMPQFVDTIGSVVNDTYSEPVQ